jgi:hypothetical protein
LLIILLNIIENHWIYIYIQYINSNINVNINVICFLVIVWLLFFLVPGPNRYANFTIWVSKATIRRKSCRVSSQNGTQRTGGPNWVALEFDHPIW